MSVHVFVSYRSDLRLVSMCHDYMSVHVFVSYRSDLRLVSMCHEQRKLSNE